MNIQTKIVANAAIERLPRIAEKITRIWGTPEFTEQMDKLCFVDRIGREGFQPDIMSELMFLQIIHDVAYPSTEKDVWNKSAEIQQE